MKLSKRNRSPRIALPRTSYEALAATAARTPDAKALSFFLSADACAEAFVWTYAELLADVTRAANAFHELGVTTEYPVAFVLPNLPETHFVIWGGETAGAVLAINPYFEPAQIANLIKTARARVLVTLGAESRRRPLDEARALLDALPDLKTVALVDAMVLRGRPRGAATSFGILSCRRRRRRFSRKAAGAARRQVARAAGHLIGYGLFLLLHGRHHGGAENRRADASE